MTSIPGRGWHVEVTHPDTGYIHRPDVVDAERLPTVNDYPRLRLTVRKDEKWDDPAFEDASITVHKDGREQPVGVLETVEQTESNTVLEARGGTALDDRVQMEVDSETTPALAEDIITNETPYVANVDARSDEFTEDVTLLDASTTSELKDAVSTTDPTKPIVISGDTLKAARVCDYTVDPSGDTPFTSAIAAPDGYTSDTDNDQGEGVEIQSVGDQVSYNFDLDYTIPENEVGVIYRIGDPNMDLTVWPRFEISVDGNTKVPVAFGFVQQNTDIKWNTAFISGDVSTGPVEMTVTRDFGSEYAGYEGSSITPTNNTISVKTGSIDTGEIVAYDSNESILGTASADSSTWQNIDTGGVTVEDFVVRNVGTEVIDDELSVRDEADGSGSGFTSRLDVGRTRLRIDALGVKDRRFSYNMDDSIDSDHSLAGPENYRTVSSRFTLQESIDAITEATFSVTIDGTTNNQAVSVSFDRGGSFDTVTNTDTITRQPSDDAVTRVVPRVTLSETDATRSGKTPRVAYESQTISNATLVVDTEAIPVIYDRQFDGPAMSVLREIADVADAIFEYRVSRDGTKSIEWTRPGERTTDREDPISEFERSKTTEEQAGLVVIRGSSQQVRGEEITADHGTAVDLDQSDLLVGKEVVYDPSTGQQYVGTGVDYSLDAQSGTITTQSGGDISDGQSIAIDYEHRPVATASNPKGRTVRRDLPSVATSRAAEQIARRIAEDLKDPLEEGQIIIPADQIGWQLVDSVDYSVVPGDSMEIRDIEHVPGQTVLSVGSRQSIDDIVGRIRGRLESVSGRV